MQRLLDQHRGQTSVKIHPQQHQHHHHHHQQQQHNNCYQQRDDVINYDDDTRNYPYNSRYPQYPQHLPLVATMNINPHLHPNSHGQVQCLTMLHFSIGRNIFTDKLF